MKLSPLRLWLAVLLVSGLASPALAAGPDFSWSEAMASGKTIKIYGVSGEIEATRAPGRQASVTAIKTSKSNQTDRVRIEATPSADGITICAIYPEKHGRESTCDEHGMHGDDMEDTDVEVAFTVQVPEGVQLDARQVNGTVQATDLASDVDASTVNGSVHLSTTGLAQARTVNGSINVSMGKGTWEHPLRMKTVNGSVRLSLPHEVNAKLSASSVNGSISSDFPVTVEGAFWSRGGKLGGTIGKGGGELTIETVNGSIVISRAGGGDGASDKKTKL